MAWIFRSSATMCSISCSSCLAPGQIFQNCLQSPDPPHLPSFAVFPTPSWPLLLVQPEPATWPDSVKVIGDGKVSIICQPTYQYYDIWSTNLGDSGQKENPTRRMTEGIPAKPKSYFHPSFTCFCRCEGDTILQEFK